MTIRSKAAEILEKTGVKGRLQAEGQVRFINNVMKWENCDYEQAVKYCTGETDPVRWEYTLGYKLADPIWSMGIFQQPGHRARARAAANFRKTLTPEEDEIFVNECMGKTARSVRKEMKSQIKKEKKRHKDVDVSELEGDDDE